MKYCTVILLMFFFVNNVMSQPKKGLVVRPLWPKNLENPTTIDKGFMRVSYALNADSIEDVSTYIDLQCLEIGKNFSRYYSQLLSNSDSLCHIWLKEHPQAREGAPSWLGEGGKRKDCWSEYQYSEIFKTDKDLTVYSRMPLYLNRYDCWHTEAYPLQQWEISSDTLSVCGYFCQKAVCRFRGRDFVAWFAPGIPVSYGPWKFGGLPGLILKIYDTDSLYIFECVHIEQVNFPIKKKDYSKYKPVERKKLLKLQRQINENYFKTAGIIDGRTKQVMSRFTSYEPLELE